MFETSIINKFHIINNYRFRDKCLSDEGHNNLILIKGIRFKKLSELDIYK